MKTPTKLRPATPSSRKDIVNMDLDAIFNTNIQMPSSQQMLPVTIEIYSTKQGKWVQAD